MTYGTRQEINAQAAAWLARLRSDERTEADIAGFQRWIEEDERHRASFETLTTMWDAAGHVEDREPAEAVSRRTVMIGAGAVATAAVAGVAGVILYRPTERLETAVGEQRKLSLADGSIVTLDTDTKLGVTMTNERRSIELLSGRANFVVARDPMRPFVVTAGARQVVAIGTAFDVSRLGDRVSVMMVEGKVVVRHAEGPGTDIALVAGDRLRFGDSPAEPTKDRPDVAASTAWQTGRAVFDDEALSDAVAELNRYQQRRLLVDGAAVGAMRISGSYQTGNPEAFARSVAELLPLKVTEGQDTIVLSARAEAN